MSAATDLGARPGHALDRAVFVVSAAFATAVSAHVAWRRSIVFEGARVFFLDDDPMISMRYARNLADGHGLVWNAGGEHVEGYSNFGWTVVMALVHVLLPRATRDAHASLAMMGVGLACTIGVLAVSSRLLKRLLPDAPWMRAVTLFAIALSGDLVGWSANGFETAPLTLLFVGAQAAIVEAERARGVARERGAAVALACGSMLPLVRADGVALWLGCAVAVVATLGGSRRLVMWTIGSILPAVAHLLWRRGYYGDWLANTYALKVDGLPRRWALGVAYLAGFVRLHATLFVVAALGSRKLRSVERWALVGAAVPSLVAATSVGGDVFHGARFFAPAIPALFIVAACAARALAADVRVRSAILALALAWPTLRGGVVTPGRLAALSSLNGHPHVQARVGLLVARNTSAEATIAVLAAGIAPYFSHRLAIDLLGKNDRHIAHLPFHAGAELGHGKFDADYSLASCPDLVLTLSSLPEIDRFIQTAPTYAPESIYASHAFVTRYRPSPIEHPFLLANGAVFACESAPEAAHRSAWR